MERPMNDRTEAPAAGRYAQILLLAAAAAFALMYWETFARLVQRWSTDENYGHGFLVPAVSLYLAYQALTENGPLPRAEGGWLLGGTLLLVGVPLRYVTVLLSSTVAECFSMLLVLAGGVCLLTGREGWRRLWVPVVFLVFMVPWPSAVYSRAAFPLQLFVSNVAAVSLELGGIPVLHEGNLIHLPGQTMHVAEACSGLRQLTAFLAICTCAALILPRPRWYKAVLLASAVPIAVLINVVRVTLTGVLLHNGFGELTRGWLHTAEGLIMVGLGLVFLWAEVKVIDWLLVGEPPQSTAEDVPRLAAA